MRGRNWLALAFGTMAVVFSYFTYVASFVSDSTDSGRSVDLGLLAIALTVSPLAFVVVGFVSRNPNAPKRVLASMGLLVILGLGIGVFDPALGAAAGFGVGIALALRKPGFEFQMRRRLIGVAGGLAYMFLLLVVAPPAGLMTGAILPALMVGFADEYGAWQVRRGAV